LGDRRSALLGFVLVVLGGVILALVRTLAPVVGAGAMVMWGVVLLNPSLTALLGATNRSLDQGALMGVNQSIASAGQMLGPLIGYAALAVLSIRGYGAACAMLALAGGLVTLRIRATDATSCLLGRRAVLQRGGVARGNAQRIGDPNRSGLRSSPSRQWEHGSEPGSRRALPVDASGDGHQPQQRTRERHWRGFG